MISQKKIISIHQPAYLPWLGYLHKIICSDIFVILDNVQFEKNSFTNRNKIKTSNGTTWITIPLNQKGHTENVISKMLLSKDNSWKKKQLKSMEYSYSKAPFFEEYIPFVRELYCLESNNFMDFFKLQFNFIINKLDIKTPIKYSSKLPIEGVKNDLVLNICKHFDANIYFSGKLGEDYLDEKKFEQAGVKIAYQEYNHPTYEQLYKGFQSHLCILDLLFNCGDKAKDIILKNNVTKTNLMEKYK